MSEPTIWDIAMGGNPPEKFVPYSDYALLKAEVERLSKHDDGDCRHFIMRTLLESQNTFLNARVEAQRRRIEGLREAGDGLWYCLRHKGAISPEERNDYLAEWIETRDNLK
jgi:hypothetical protein